ncbi:hypothetical protein Nepgr_029403 [Nepenthes gracilis]|uniref:BZIP domain-containing protein n=1 Tax=Nepenthes gracilis TaxID=150966 RepID=A0AAD3TCE7_NEPGR|nr:hypothetical protein Nepgr_029403 [Nepenthes gracilis]
MESGEVELSDHALISNPSSSSNNVGGSSTVDSLLDELLNNTRTCTHTHTCNPPGPDAAHTHTCYHTHTHWFASGEDSRSTADNNLSAMKSKRPLGNREAVRKYREKKKAQEAYLEEEVKKLRLLNQQLIRKLQGQAILEAEILRLRSILLNIRGNIDNELVAYPFQSHCNAAVSFKDGESGSSGGCAARPCKADVPWRANIIGSGGGGGGGEEVVFSWEGSCQPGAVGCHIAANEMSSAVPEKMVSSTNHVE